jgi:hypothetical protein
LVETEEYKREIKISKKDIKPIMIIRSPRDNDLIEANFAKMNIDQLWIKHYIVSDANILLLNWVKEHKNEYTHVIMTTDDVTFSEQDLNQLIEDLQKYDFPILTGVCNYCTLWSGEKIGVCKTCENGEIHKYISATFTPLNDVTEKGKFLHETKGNIIVRDTYDFITEEWRVNNPIIKEIYFHGIALTVFKIDIFLLLEGLHLYAPQYGHECDDVNLAINCYNRGIPQFADFRIFVRHHGEKSIYGNINSSTNSKIVFIPKRK